MGPMIPKEMKFNLHVMHGETFYGCHTALTPVLSGDSVEEINIIRRGRKERDGKQSGWLLVHVIKIITLLRSFLLLLPKI